MGPASPNPAMGQAKMNFTLQEDGPCSLNLYDPAGRMVGVIADVPMCEDPGAQGEIFWEPDLRSGVYSLRLEAGGLAVTRRLVIQ